MKLTEEEKQDLLRQKAEAATRCREVWSTVVQLRKILQSYEAIHRRWKSRYEVADRTLALAEKVKTFPLGKRAEDLADGLHLINKLSKDQLRKVLEELEGGDE